MAQLLVRILEEWVKLRLQRSAMAGAWKTKCWDILRKAASEDEKPSIGLGTKLASMMVGSGIKFDVEELRGNSVEAATFDE